MHSVDSACTSFQRAAESDLEKIIPAVSGSGHQQEGILRRYYNLERQRSEELTADESRIPPDLSAVFSHICSCRYRA